MCINYYFSKVGDDAFLYEPIPKACYLTHLKCVRTHPAALEQWLHVNYILKCTRSIPILKFSMIQLEFYLSVF